MTSPVELEGVHRRYRSRTETVHAVNGVSFILRRGALTGLVGPSGSGKTTLINLIAGWERPDAGAVHRDPAIGDDWHGLAVVPQNIGLLSELTIEENISLPIRLGNASPVDPHTLMAEIGVGGLEGRMPDETSLGEQQRAAVARALVADPVVLVADEPTSHQDEGNALVVAGMLRRAAASGTAVLIATHDERILAEADEVIRIESGRVVEGPAPL